MGLQRGLGEKIKQIKSQDDIKSHSKTENLQTLRNTFPETKSKRMKQLNYKIKPKGKKRKRSRKVHKNKSNGKGWDKKEKGVTRYYLEDGKYEENPKFDGWAERLTSMWAKVKVDTSCQCGISGGGRIVNGAEAKAHSYPWMAAMMNRTGFYYCGGSVISDEWILTAAHCVAGDPNNPTENMYVRLGDHDLTDKGDATKADTFQVDYYIQHTNYNDRTTNNDVALLKLKEKIDFKKFAGTVAPVCLPDLPRKYYDKTVTVAGWGLLTEGGEAPRKLHEVDLEVLWMKDCRENFKYKKNWISHKMMCTYKKNADACQGDSGGPVVWRNPKNGIYEQVGLVSWGIGCARPKYPGVNTKLSHFLIWILKRTSKSTFCLH